MSDEQMEAAMDSTYVAEQSAEIHAKLIEAREAIANDHEGRAALLVDEACDEMSDLTSDIEQV
jgi:hypothetical protein